MSYNSYLIVDDKTAIMDTVDKRKSDEWLSNLEDELAGSTPDYLVISHMEPDHAYSIQILTEKYPQMQIIGNTKTLSMIPQFFDIDVYNRFITVSEGDIIDLGLHKLTFYMAPMVHWPEVMVTYESSEKILFSADAFGKFGALDTQENWDCEARRYYFNICGKYGTQVQSLLKKISSLEVNAICPLHGPMLTNNLSHYIDLYDKWSRYEPETDGIFIAHASIHGNTKNAVLKLCEMLKAKTDKKIEVLDLARDDMAEAVENAFRYSKMIVAASSYDAGVFPCMATFLNLLKSKGYKNRKVGIMENGSWAPTAAKVMRSYFDNMQNVEVCDTVVTLRSTIKKENVLEMNVLCDEIIRS